MDMEKITRELAQARFVIFPFPLSESLEKANRGMTVVMCEGVTNNLSFP